MAWIKAYKGFNDKLQCTPRNNVFQYEVGKEYATDAAELCESGFHACEFPLDVFRYYAPSDSRYCEVELDATDEQRHDGSKRTGKKIKIGAEIGLDGIIKAGVKLILEKAESCDKGTDNQSAATNTGDWSVATNTGDWSAATNTGDRSAATNTGDRSAATNTGDWSAATNTGYQSAATNTGDWSAATNTGDRSAATNTGDRSAATNTGDWSAATNPGDRSAATNTGYQSAASVTGEESVACSLGIEGKAKGAKGCWIVLAEWKDGHRTDVKCFLVDGEEIRENTFYMLRDGKAVEVKD